MLEEEEECHPLRIVDVNGKEWGLSSDEVQNNDQREMGCIKQGMRGCISTMSSRKEYKS